jgi:hypothetical protein
MYTLLSSVTSLRAASESLYLNPNRLASSASSLSRPSSTFSSNKALERKVNSFSHESLTDRGESMRALKDKVNSTIISSSSTYVPFV